MNQRELELREKSGNISTTDPMVVFLYILAKDYLTIRQVEELLERTRGVLPGPILFNNGWLGQYAINLKNQIDGTQREKEQPVTAKSQGVIDDADTILGQLQNTLSPEEIMRVKDDIKKYNEERELELLFKDLVIEDVDGRIN